MTESTFTWRKILSFFGVAILAFIAMVACGAGGYLISKGQAFYGVFSVLGGLCATAGAVLLYKNYENRKR